MNDIKKANGNTEITTEDHVLNAHEYLKEFLRQFEQSKRGGIHDFIEMSLFNMVLGAVTNIDEYLKSGHKVVNGSEVMHRVVDSYQVVLDKMKRNLEGMEEVYFQ